jgi:hypothetical protein
LKKCLHKKKKESKRYMSEALMVLEELSLAEQERMAILEKNKQLEKSLKPKIKVVEKVVYLKKNSILSPVMIHLFIFWLMNVLFTNHIAGMGIDDVYAIQFGVFVLNAIYICTVGYFMSVYDM